MDLKERTQAIRNILKEKGWNSSKISVRGRYCGYSDSVDVTIKSPEINRDEVEKLISNYESIRYDQYSGEILEGCNEFLFVQYAYGIFDDVSKPFIDEAKAAIEKAKVSNGCGVTIHPKYYVFVTQDHCVPFINSNEMYGIADIYSPEHLAKMIYQLKTFNKIVVR